VTGSETPSPSSASVAVAEALEVATLWSNVGGKPAEALLTLAAEVRRLQAQHPATRNESGAAPLTSEHGVVTQRPDHGGDAKDAADLGVLDDALLLLRQPGAHASPSYVQRKLQIGYQTAALILENLERLGFVTPPDSVGRRQLAARAEPPAEAKPLSSCGATFEASEDATKSVVVQQPDKGGTK
jgi:DNA segregation ATPase FtsK/SpoIIIE-like protein